MKKTVFSILVLVLMFIMAAGCGEQAGVTSEDNPETVIDSTGREITLPAKPQRIVSLMPSKTEKLFALGLGDQIVGITDMCDYPEELNNMEITRVGDAFNLNIEVIVSLEPDLVVANWLPEGLAEQFDDLEIPVFIYAPMSIADTMESIQFLGKLTGHQAEAERTVSEMEMAIEAVTNRVAQIEGEKVKVLFLLDEYIYVSGPGTMQDELIVKAGGINAVEEAGWPQLSEEVFLTLDPDVILYSFPGGEEFLNRTEWQVLDCIREGRFFKLDESLTSRTGPRLSQGLKQIVELLYPK